jgi:hypothetical protein
MGFRTVEEAGANMLSWEDFVFLFLKFNSLTKVELGQCLFHIVVKEIRSWTKHYLSASQLGEFFRYWSECPFQAFNYHVPKNSILSPSISYTSYSRRSGEGTSISAVLSYSRYNHAAV